MKVKLISLKLDVDENPSTAAKFEVMSIPNFNRI
ncbi:thioredoxin [Staphylococcus gallinarum]|uniref:Thioredoxin n=1 Tax=Staphylococcus gallinarum TaxID=1293 RepID=A0A380FEC0_STAGA|nr:thioredoxin [Staphylococcus gallinarum]